MRIKPFNHARIRSNACMYLPKLIPILWIAITSSNVSAQQSITIEAMLQQISDNEPNYRAGLSALDGARARIGIQEAASYPTANLNWNSTSNRRRYQELTEGAEVQPNKYKSDGGQVSISQPLFKLSIRPATEQAKQAAEQSFWQSRGALNDLLLKSVQFWLDWAQAVSAQELAVAQLNALDVQVLKMQIGLNLGHSSAPMLDDVVSKQQSAAGDIVIATLEQQIKAKNLRQLGFLGELNLLRPVIKSDKYIDVSGPNANGESCNAAVASVASPIVKAAVAGIEVAKFELQKQAVVNTPTIEITANFGTSSQAVGGLPSQPGYNQGQRSIALQVNWPLYSGWGALESRNREAAAAMLRAELEAEAARQQATANFEIARLSQQSALARLKAARAQMQSAQSTLKLEQESVKRGLKTEFDTLTAISKLKQSQNDIEKAVLEFTVQRLRELASCGPLDAASVASAIALVVQNEALP